MTTVFDFVIIGLIQGFTTAFALAFNEWLFKRRIEKALNRFEKHVKRTMK